MSMPSLSAPDLPSKNDRLFGTLLGTAVGDALGLPFEGGRPEEERLAKALLTRRVEFESFGSIGIVSDDTEQSVLVAEAIVAAERANIPRESQAEFVAHHFRSALLGWFFRLPWGIGWGTLRACIRIGISRVIPGFFRETGVSSAGNGAAMRAAIIGVYYTNAEERHAVGEALARTTHTDARAVAAALFVSDVAAALATGGRRTRASLETQLRACAEAQRQRSPAFASAVDDALSRGAYPTNKRTGYALESVPFAAFCLVSAVSEGHVLDEDAAFSAITAAAYGGGDTDTNAAIVGAWVGATLGSAGFANLRADRLEAGTAWLSRIGFASKTHLRMAAEALAEPRSAPSYAWSRWRALGKNLLLYPVVLFHGVLVLLRR